MDPADVTAPPFYHTVGSALQKISISETASTECLHPSPLQTSVILSANQARRDICTNIISPSYGCLPRATYRNPQGMSLPTSALHTSVIRLTTIRDDTSPREAGRSFDHPLPAPPSLPSVLLLLRAVPSF